MIVHVEIRLAATEDDGRVAAVSSGYRPTFWFNNEVDAQGGRVMSGASLEFDVDLLRPGETTLGTLSTFGLHEPPGWASLAPGMEVDFYEGARKTGTIRVLSVDQTSILTK